MGDNGRIGRHRNVRSVRVSRVLVALALIAGLAGCSSTVPETVENPGSVPSAPTVTPPATPDPQVSTAPPAEEETANDTAPHDTGAQETSSEDPTPEELRPAEQAFQEEILHQTWDAMSQTERDGYCSYFRQEPEYAVEVWVNSGLFDEALITAFFEEEC